MIRFPDPQSRTGISLLNKSAKAAFSAPKSILFTAASAQSVNFGTAMRPAYNQPFSIEVWWFPTELLANRAILSNYSGGSNGYFQLYNNLTALIFTLSGNTGGGILEVHPTGNPLALNQWFHLVITYDGSNASNGFHVYVNGADQALTATHNTAISALTYGGNTLLGNDAASDVNSGYFNRISYWGAALSSAQVTALYNKGKTAEIKGSANLVNYYLPGNGQDTSTTIYDLQGTANGTIVNSAPYKPFAPFAFAFANTVQIKNYPEVNAPIVGGNMFMPYYQAGNPDTGFGAPDMEVFSLSNPTSPSVIGTLAYTGGTIGTITPQTPMVVEGNYAYINYYKGTTKCLNIVDISDPTNPTVVATIDSGIVNLHPTGAYKHGNYIYQPGYSSNGAGTNKLLITKVTTPASPTFIGAISIPDAGDWNSVAFVSGYLYLGTNSTLTVYNLTNPESPSQVTSIVTAGTAYYMKQNGNYLYLCEHGANKMEIVDVSNPTSPSIVKTLSVPTGPNTVNFTSSNNLAYLVNAQGGLGLNGSVSIYSIYDPPNAFLAGTVTLPTFATTGDQHGGTGIEINGNTAYVLAIDGVTLAGDIYGFLDIYGL